MGSPTPFDQNLKYPAVRRDETVVENYHGVLVPDPYRWLEDHDSAETQEFVDKQNELTESVLKTCEFREKFSESLTNSFDFPKYDPPFRASNKVFYFHNTGLQPYDVVYIQDGLDGKPEILIDGNTISDDGTVTLCDAVCVPSDDAKYLAYGITLNGSDFITIKVMRIEDKTTGPDTVSWAKFPSVCWTKDSKGFFYCRYEAPAEEENLDAEIQISANRNHDIYYHFLGTDQSEDVLCWRDPSNPTENRAVKVTEDGKYVLIFLRENCNESKKVYYCDLSSLPNGLADYKGTTQLLPFVKLVDNFDASYAYVANDDTVFTFVTSKDAPRNKLVRVDLNEPSSWTDVIPEHERDVIESVVAVNGNQIVVNYMSDVKSVLQIRDLRTGDFLHHLPLDIGAVSEISSRREDSIIFIEFISFLVPGIIYICNLEGEVPDMRIFRETVVPGLDRTQFESTQVFVPTKDGSAKIPLFITAKKGIRLDGSHPCVMHGYGGFAIKIAPFFSVSRLLVVKHFDGVFCVANIRGGSEYGEEWHKAAYLGKKQKSFDDFISAAEYLVSAGYTQPSKLCIEGASNGGLLVGACINQRPDLFGCAVPDCSVMDMLRFHKFTIGHGWTSDYGCSDKEEDFHWLIKYSPLHNVRRPWDTPSNKHVQYPATMIMTAEHDDRVVSLHTYKLLATMQYELCTSVENSPQKNPIIGRIEREAGHGSGMSTQLRIAEAVDQFAFMAKATGATWVD